MTRRLGILAAVVALAVLTPTGASADIVSVSPAQAKTNEPVTVAVESVEGDSCLAFEPESLDYTTSDGPQPCGTGSWSVTVVVGTVPDGGTMAIIEVVDGAEVNRIEIGVVEGSGTTTTTSDTTTTTAGTTTTTEVTSDTATEATTTTVADTTTTTTQATTTTTAPTTTSTTVVAAGTTTTTTPGSDGRDFPGGPAIPAALVIVGAGLMIWGGVFRVFRR